MTDARREADSPCPDRDVHFVMEIDLETRRALVRRGLWLNYLTLFYNTLEAAVTLTAGVIAGSVALVGFGVDSWIEVAASVAAQWRLRADKSPTERERIERLVHRLVGATFLALAFYVLIDATTTRWAGSEPRPSRIGVAMLLASVVVMPILARAKRNVAARLESRALRAEATQTSLCAYLSLIGLVGVGLNALLNWWWADPVCALVMVPIIAREGVDSVRGTPESGRITDPSRI